jgi:hypothetical protein
LTFDNDNNPRNRLTEVNKYGDSKKYTLERTYVGDGSVASTATAKPTEYIFYLSDTVQEGVLSFKYGNQSTIKIPFVNPLVFNIDPDTGKVTEKINDFEVTFDQDLSILNASLLDNKLSSFASVSAENPDALPTIDNPYTITYNNTNDVTPFAITNPDSIVETTWSYNNDLLLGDDELVSLPIQISNSTDISSIITIRSRAQNTWNRV